MSEASVLLSAVQQRIVSALDDFKNTLDQQPPGPEQQSLLLRLINDPNADVPDPKALDFSSLLDGLGLDGLFGNVRSLIEGGQGGGRLSLPVFNQLNLGNLRGFVQNLLANGNPIDTIKGEIDALRQATGGTPLPDAIRGILGRQASIGISFITTLKNLASRDLPEQVVKGWMQYFFGENGYRTLDGIQIVAPGRAAQGAPDLAGLQRGLKGLLNERSGEQYVRDLIRITVEVGGNLRYDLEARLPRLGQKVDPKAQDKAVRWFTGAGSMAESLVTSAVEELALGIAQFQTNPVIAAAAATYAGTASRKASQHAFLADVGV
jgi:hypothetical protein